MALHDWRSRTVELQRAAHNERTADGLERSDHSLQRRGAHHMPRTAEGTASFIRSDEQGDSSADGLDPLPSL